MKKLLLIVAFIPFLIYSQTDTTQNRIVVSEDVNECIQEIYQSPDGIGMLARKIAQDKNKMQELRDELIDDPAVHDMIRNARENMRSGNQGQQSEIGNRGQEKTENDVNTEQNSTRVERDINTCIDMVYDNPDAIKLLMSIVLSNPEKTREARQQVMNIPEFQEAARELRSNMGDSDFDRDKQDQNLNQDDTQLNEDPETNRIDTTGEKSMYLDDPDKDNIPDSDTLRVK